MRRGEIRDVEETVELLHTALLLHQALPESGYASQRALLRLARCQAQARAFGMVGFLRSLLEELSRQEPVPAQVPGNLVRDIELPPFDRSFLEKQPKAAPAVPRRAALAGVESELVNEAVHGYALRLCQLFYSLMDLLREPYLYLFHTDPPRL